MSKIDLHLHSYFSDGEHSPEKIFQKAVSRGVSLLSLVDHNYLPEEMDVYKKEGERAGIRVVEGIEISSMDRQFQTSFHILGYSNNFRRALINEGLNETVDGYNRRAKGIIEKLNMEIPGIGLDFEGIIKGGHEVYVSRNTLARIVVRFLGDTITIKEALKKYIFIEENDSWMLSPKECFSLIHNGGGVSVLAHSGRELRKMGIDTYRKMVETFKEQGLDGIEVFYPKHSEQEIADIRQVAKENGLFITGGSDWHGETYTPQTEIGMQMGDSEIQNFIDMVR